MRQGRWLFKNTVFYPYLLWYYLIFKWATRIILLIQISYLQKLVIQRIYWFLKWHSDSEEKFHFLIMTTEIRKNIKKTHIIIQKVSRFPSLHISVKSLKIIRNYTCKQTKQGWTLIWMSHNCNCCLKIGTVVLTQWEKNWNLKFFDVYSKKYAFIEGTS